MRVGQPLPRIETMSLVAVAGNHGRRGRILTLPPADDSVSLSPRSAGGERTPRHFDALCAPELGKDAFHRVPDFALNEWDAVERVLTILEDRFRWQGRKARPRAWGFFSKGSR
jgi:hypothetical protein